ncbi:hypothetical protein, partial [Burkholderia pseudomallei]|uniref:hypothetical protein n=1 Tax=Burkholderia pseudomallei TaxID=28450 RepID=UPI001CA4D12E
VRAASGNPADAPHAAVPDALSDDESTPAKRFSSASIFSMACAEAPCPTIAAARSAPFLFQ